MGHQDLAERLAGAGIDDVVVDPDVHDSYRRDAAAPGLLAAGLPAVLLRPKTTAEVQAAVRIAAEQGVPVVPRGAGSGLSGGANAIDGCIVLRTEAMDDIVDLEPDSMQATVGPGLVNGALKEAAAVPGLTYAPDPASFEFSTIGGNVATNAGGLCCVRHGVTRDAVLGLEVVLADGRAIRVGGRTRKNVAGYDLVSLFCGSEGTLGIVTEVCVRLVRAPGAALTMAASFPDVGAAGRAIVGIMHETEPLLLELMDRATLDAVEAMQPMELEPTTAALVFARTERGHDELERMAEIADSAGADFVATSDDEAEGRMLMAARRLAYPSLERLGRTLLDDVGVPIGEIPALLEGVAKIAARRDVTIGTFGHAGEGNMHPTIVYPPDDAEAAEAARHAFEEIVDLALSLGGTITGEHGVGLLKREFMTRAVGASVQLHHAVKQALDPHGILNPGKAI
ncbi:MAG: FAD-binding protein [Actinobacteria bacterium]|nr:FAD-binding protein [Actinomycetota bacterium]